MTKLTKKEKLLIIISLVIIIAIGSAFAHLYNEKNNWHNVAAEYNRNQWSEIHLIAFQMKERGFTKETISEMYPYINAKIHSSISGLYPSFNGKSPYYSMLGTYYVSLAQDIWVSHNLTDEKMQEAIDIFEDATLALEELSFDILEMTEDRKNKIELRKIGSPIYNEAEKMIYDYCNTYGEKISNFNQLYDRTATN